MYNKGIKLISLTDNIDLTRAYGEINFIALEKIDFQIKGNYYNYLTELEQKAWHKPAFDVTVSANYNLRDKILISTSIYGMSERYAKPYGENENLIKLKAFADLNVEIEYRYTKILSFFINFYNISSAKYYEWNQYPVYKFGVIGGFTYALWNNIEFSKFF